ncbi:MAG: hypothetical protein B5M48_02120 [Candidatus Omnitrophica bacterium 4484_213]|nr:MAG: hypothetical protein B5M48_02120 [Candidatus Omnitrophica bacterium 4484_213]
MEFTCDLRFAIWDFLNFDENQSLVIMLLAIDIGNTNISLGLFKQSKIVDKWKVSSSRYGDLFKGRKKRDIEAIIICSVVPALEQRVEKSLQEELNISPLVVGRNVSVALSNLYQEPKQVGQDRLVNSLAAAEIYGFPVIVIDFGTAITFDFVSQNREYLGGVIVPGIKLSVDALSQKAALLPTIDLVNLSEGFPKDLLGRSTVQSMLAGAAYGFGGLCDEIIRKMREKYGRDILTVGTGGEISFIKDYCSQINKIDEELSLRGLWLIYKQKNRER